MTWDQRSRRRSELPHDWSTIRRDVLERDGYACTVNGPRCTGHANQADHIGDRHNHSRTNLRAACYNCHADRTATQGHAAMRVIRAKAYHPREQHPGHA